MRSGPQFVFGIHDDCQVFDMFSSFYFPDCSKSTRRKTRSHLVACCAVEWRGVSVKRVVSGSFWVVADGFCWLWVILDGFRWFAILVVTRIHNIQKSYFFTILKNAHDWLTSFDFFIQSRTARKRLLFSCRLTVWVLFPILYCVLFQIKTSFKRKQPQNTKQVEYCELFKTGSFGGESLKIIQKQGDYSR